MQNKLNEYDFLIAKYLDNNNFSQEDEDILLNWINTSEENRAYFEQMAKVWEKSIITLQDKSLSQTRFNDYKKQFVKEQKRQLYKWVMGVAAMAIFLFTGFLMFQTDFLFGRKMLIVKADTIKQEIILPDGSVVWLNANSSLKYPSKFKKERNVLLEGEGYFDVVEDNNRTFIVNTENLTIEVKGTTFLVTDHEDRAVSETVLESGAVELTINSSGKKIELKPDQQIIYDHKTGKTILNQVNAADYTGWRAESLVFENTPLRVVFIQLEKWYNINIECTNEYILNIPVSFTVDNEAISETLELLRHITALQWSKSSDNKIIIN